MNMVLGTHLSSQAEKHKSILSFYAIALTDTTNHITVSSFHDFRLLVKSLLDTQLVYHNPLYIAESQGALPKHTVDIYKALTTHMQNTDIHIDELLQDFVINNLFGDILFIEETNSILVQPWYSKFIKIIQANTMYMTIPVIIASEETQHFVT